MKTDPLPPLRGTDPRERFLELGKKIMAVSKTEVDAREKKWQQARKRLRKR